MSLLLLLIILFLSPTKVAQELFPLLSEVLWFHPDSLMLFALRPPRNHGHLATIAASQYPLITESLQELLSGPSHAGWILFDRRLPAVELSVPLQVFVLELLVQGVVVVVIRVAWVSFDDLDHRPERRHRHYFQGLWPTLRLGPFGHAPLRQEILLHVVLLDVERPQLMLLEGLFQWLEGVFNPADGLNDGFIHHIVALQMGVRQGSRTHLRLLTIGM